MQINLSKQAGFCFGVERALDLVEESIAKFPKPLYMYGPLVHNEDVVKKLEEKKITSVESIDEVPSGTIIITAHGTSPDIIRKAKEKGLEVFDTTCLRVKEVHDLARELNNEGRTIIIYGDPEHVEVKGIVGEVKGNAHVISDIKGLRNLEIDKRKPVGLLSQTTQEMDRFAEISKAAASLFSDIKVNNTICGSTRGRQIEIKDLAKDNDVMVIVGSRRSANTKRLNEVSGNINPKTHWVINASELRPEWFKGAGQVGISGGASTPDWVIDEVIKKIKSWSNE